MSSLETLFLTEFDILIDISTETEPDLNNTEAGPLESCCAVWLQISWDSDADDSVKVGGRKMQLTTCLEGSRSWSAQHFCSSSLPWGVHAFLAPDPVSWGALTLIAIAEKHKFCRMLGTTGELKSSRTAVAEWVHLGVSSTDSPLPGYGVVWPVLVQAWIPVYTKIWLWPIWCSKRNATSLIMTILFPSWCWPPLAFVHAVLQHKCYISINIFADFISSPVIYSTCVANTPTWSHLERYVMAAETQVINNF